LVTVEGYRYVGYESLQEVHESLDTIRRARLIILDMIIPVGNSDEDNREHFLGLEVLRELEHAGICLPVIVYSVVREQEVLAAVREFRNVKGVFQKGGTFELAGFRDLVRQCLRGSTE